MNGFHSVPKAVSGGLFTSTPRLLPRAVKAAELRASPHALGSRRFDLARSPLCARRSGWPVSLRTKPKFEAPIVVIERRPHLLHVLARKGFTQADVSFVSLKWISRVDDALKLMRPGYGAP